MHDLYQAHVLSHVQHPHHKGVLDRSTHSGHSTNASCGDDLTLHLRIENDTITDATFTGTGCAISQATASMLTDVLITLPFTDATHLAEATVDRLLGFKVSTGREKCAYLCLAALRNALEKHE